MSCRGSVPSHRRISTWHRERPPGALRDPSLTRSRYWRDDVSWYGTGPTVDLSGDSRGLAFCLHGASQVDDDIYVMINAHWEELEFHVQEGAAQEWKRIVDTALPSPDDSQTTVCL